MTTEASQVGSIPVDQIITSMVLRPVKKHRVDFLVWDFGVQGQLQPVLVVQREDGFHLLDGMHRYEAARILKRQVLDAKILPLETTENEARFAALMANINREELTKLERAEYLAELDAEIKRNNPGARHGGDRRSQGVAAKQMEEAGGGQAAIFATCSDLAEALGISERLIDLACQISSKLADETKARIRAQRTDENPKGSSLEEHQSDLLKLAKLNAEEQLRVCDFLFSTPPQAECVADAITLAGGGELTPVTEKRANRFDGTWSRMAVEDRADFVITHFEVIAQIIRENGLSI